MKRVLILLVAMTLATLASSSLFVSGRVQAQTSGQVAPADYDGDGRADLSMKADDGRWLIDYASNGFGAWDATFYGYGGSDSHAVPRDYDGDGLADLCVHNTSTARWQIDYAYDGYGYFNFDYGGYGYSENREAQADYDGDGRAEIGIYSITQTRQNIDY